MRAKKTFLPSAVDPLETREVPATLTPFPNNNFLAPPTTTTIPRAAFFSLGQSTPNFALRGTTPTTPSHSYPTGVFSPYSLSAGSTSTAFPSPTTTATTGTSTPSFLNPPTSTTIPRATFFASQSPASFNAILRGTNTTPSNFYPTNGTMMPFGTAATPTTGTSTPSFLNPPTSTTIPRTTFFASQSPASFDAILRGTNTTPSNFYPTNGTMMPFGTAATPTTGTSVPSFLNPPTSTTIPRATFFGSTSPFSFGAGSQGAYTPPSFSFANFLRAPAVTTGARFIL